MAPATMSLLVAAFILLVTSPGCTGSSFTGSAGGDSKSDDESKSSEKPLADPEAENDSEPDPEVDLGTEQGEGSDDPSEDDDVDDTDSVLKPQRCDRAAAKVIGTGGKCPDHFAPIVSGNGGGADYICCPLPAKDILTGPETVRSNACAANEVIIGIVSSSEDGGQYNCKALNTKKYKLEPSAQACFWKIQTSASGQGNAAVCGSDLQEGFLRLLTDTGDGCAGVPFGSLMVERREKYCDKQRSARLVDKAGKPVTIVKP